MKLPNNPSVMSTSVHDNIMMFFGNVGVGKTYFISKLFPKVFFISTDAGTRQLNTFRQEVSTYEEIKEVIKLLAVNPGKYDAVCFDHVDDICTLIEHGILKQLGIPSLFDGQNGKGWRAYRSAMFDCTRKLMKAGYSIIYAAHAIEKDIEFRGREITKTMPRLNKTAWEIMVPMCHLIGYCTCESTLDKGEIVYTRKLYTKPSQELEVKDNTNRNKPAKGVESLNAKKFLATFHTV